MNLKKDLSQEEYELLKAVLGAAIAFGALAVIGIISAIYLVLPMLLIDLW